MLSWIVKIRAPVGPGKLRRVLGIVSCPSGGTSLINSWRTTDAILEIVSGAENEVFINTINFAFLALCQVVLVSLVKKPVRFWRLFTFLYYIDFYKLIVLIHNSFIRQRLILERLCYNKKDKYEFFHVYVKSIY